MNVAIEIIRDEHRSLSAILNSLQTQVEAACSGSSEPDFFLFSAMLDYIEAFPERQHHPKEDQFLFRFLRQRTDRADTVLDELERQHRQSRDELRALRSALQAWREGGSADDFAEAFDGYIRFHWDHMQQEENIVLPLAEECLSAEDWRIIEAAFEANRAPDW